MHERMDTLLLSSASIQKRLTVTVGLTVFFLVTYSCPELRLAFWSACLQFHASLFSALAA